MTNKDWMKLSEDLDDMCKRMDALADHLALDFKDETGKLPEFIEDAVQNLDDTISSFYNAREHIYRLVNKIGEYNEDSHS